MDSSLVLFSCQISVYTFSHRRFDDFFKGKSIPNPMLLLWKLVYTFRELEIGGKKSRPWTPALFYFLVRFRCRAKGVHCENSRLPLAAGKQKSRIPPEKPDSFYNSCVILHGFFMNSTAICCSDKNKTGEKIQNKLLTLFLIWFFFLTFSVRIF